MYASNLTFSVKNHVAPRLISVEQDVERAVFFVSASPLLLTVTSLEVVTFPTLSFVSVTVTVLMLAFVLVVVVQVYVGCANTPKLTLNFPGVTS